MKLTLRWPESLCNRVVNVARANNLTVQAVITKLVCDSLGIQVWRKEYSRSRDFDREVETILRRYNYVPEDLQEEIEYTKLFRKNGAE